VTLRVVGDISLTDRGGRLGRLRRLGRRRIHRIRCICDGVLRGEVVGVAGVLIAFTTATATGDRNDDPDQYKDSGNTADDDPDELSDGAKHAVDDLLTCLVPIVELLDGYVKSTVPKFTDFHLAA